MIIEIHTKTLEAKENVINSINKELNKLEK